MDYLLPYQRWRIFECGDCDPTTGDPERADEWRARYGDRPFTVIVPDDGSPGTPDWLDVCPRCGSYGGMNEGTTVAVEARRVSR
jgi:hypothetical protein